MNLVTGSKGYDHVSSNNDGEFNQAIWGSGLVVLSNGNQLRYEILNNTTFRVADGDLVFQGRHALIEAGEHEDVTISAGTNNYNRIDLIVAHYEMDVEGNESIDLRYIKGAESAGNPTAPAYTTGVIRTGSPIAESPLYKLTYTGLNVVVEMIPQIVADLLGQVGSKQPLVTGSAVSITNSKLAANKAVVTDNSQNISASTLDAGKLTYLSDVTGNIQSQLNGKQSTITGSAASVVTEKLDSNKVVVTDGSKMISNSSVDASKLEYLANVTSDIQNQLDVRDIQKSTSWIPDRMVALSNGSKLYTVDMTPAQAKSLATDLSNRPMKEGTLQHNMVVVVDAQNETLKSSNITVTKLGYLSDVTKNIQANINTKQDKITGGASSVVTNNLTASRAVISNANGKIVASSITSTELSYLDGVTSKIQSQINDKANRSGWDAGYVMISNANGNLTASTLKYSDAAQLKGVKDSVQDQLDDKISKSGMGIASANTTSTGSGSISVANNTKVSLGYFKLTKGYYILNLYASFSSSSSGYRSIWLATTSTGDAMSQGHIVQYAPSASGSTKIALPCVVNATADAWYYIVAQQNSGSTLTVSNIRYSYIKF